MKTITIKTPAGAFHASFTERGLARLEFPGRADTSQSNGTSPAIPSRQTRHWEHLTRAAVESLLDGHVPKELPPLDLSDGTEFQRRVWNALKAIPLGKTKSYGQIAQTVGRPDAARAVGQACGANPIPLLIPCHRVLAANRKLGGFSGGLDWKKRLLAVEKIQLG